MASAQVAVKRAGSRSKQSNGATQTHHEATATQVASSQVDFNQSLEDRLKTRQAYRGLRSDTYGEFMERFTRVKQVFVTRPLFRSLLALQLCSDCSVLFDIL